MRNGEKMQHQSIKSQVYEGILNDIMDGVYPSNAVLNEKTIVEKYQVSKTPVREALVQLCSEEILKNIPRFGYQVVPISPSEILEIIEYRKVIELAALELSFPRLTEVEFEELKKLNEESRKIVEVKEPRTHWRRNEEFHRYLAGYCSNKFLQQALDTSLNFCTRISNQYFTKLWNESKQADAINHVVLVEAMEAGDLDKAKNILSGDIDSFKNEIL